MGRATSVKIAAGPAGVANRTRDATMAAPSLSSFAPDPIEIARQRAVLFSARIQYGPETQPIRERAIDRLVEQDLLISDCESGQNVDQIYSHGVRNGLRIHRNDLVRSLERLKIAGRI